MPETEKTRGLLLDTHAWLWMQLGESRMQKPEIQRALLDAVDLNRLWVSVISVWEFALLESKGRLAFEGGLRDWIKKALSIPGILLLPLSPEIAIESAYLPGSFHADPADRILAATARMRGVRLVTADQRIIAFGRTGHVEVLEV